MIDIQFIVVFNNTMSNDKKLRSKRELIERFLQSNLPKIIDTNDVENEFNTFWNEEQIKAFHEMCSEENLNSEKAQVILDRYMSTGRIPRDFDLADVLKEQPSILKRESIISKIKARITKYIETFIE